MVVDVVIAFLALGWQLHHELLRVVTRNVDHIPEPGNDRTHDGLGRPAGRNDADFVLDQRDVASGQGTLDGSGVNRTVDLSFPVHPCFRSAVLLDLNTDPSNCHATAPNNAHEIARGVIVFGVVG
jgi:hypothetical protein